MVLEPLSITVGTIALIQACKNAITSLDGLVTSYRTAGNAIPVIVSLAHTRLFILGKLIEDWQTIDTMAIENRSQIFALINPVLTHLPPLLTQFERQISDNVKTSISQKVKWMIWREKSLQEIVKQMDEFIQPLHQLRDLVKESMPADLSLTLQVSHSPADSFTPEPAILSESDELQCLQIAVSRLRHPKRKDEPWICNFAASKDWAELDGRRVLIEIKPWDAEMKINRPEELGFLRRRFATLVKVLRVSDLTTVHDVAKSIPNILPCIGFSEDFQIGVAGAFLLIYDVPKSTVPLSSLLPGWRSSSQPLLISPRFEASNIRWALAGHLIRAVQLLHGLHYVHEAINPHNFYITDAILPHKDAMSCGQLAGFQLSRSSDGQTDKVVETDGKLTLYRHFRRQKHTMDRHTQKHDMYSLGLMLYTILRWQPLHRDMAALDFYYQDISQAIPQGLLQNHICAQLGMLPSHYTPLIECCVMDDPPSIETLAEMYNNTMASNAEVIHM